jgi:hypothetical protein
MFTRKQRPEVKRTRKLRRPLAIILGSALLLGSLFYTLNRIRTPTFFEKPAKVGYVEKQFEIDHFINGDHSRNYQQSTAILSADPPRVMILKTEEVIRGVDFVTDKLKNERMRVFGDKVVVCADNFLAYLTPRASKQIPIDDFESLDTTNIDCTFLNGEVFFVGSGKSAIVRMDPKTTSSTHHPTDRIREIEGFSGFVNPSITSSQGRIFLLSDGMKHLYSLDFVGMKRKYERLEKIIGISKAKNMRIAGIGDELYLIDDTHKKLYRIDPKNLSLIDKHDVR